MSDLFVSEVLVLFFLLVVLLRPFSKALKNLPSVLIFPIIAFFLSVLVIVGQGLYFSTFLILVLSVVVFLFVLPKFAAFVMGLSTKIYSTVEIVVHSLGLVLVLALLFLVWKFAPESLPNMQGKIVREKLELKNFSESSVEVLLLTDSKTNAPVNPKNAKTSIIFLPNVKKSFYKTNVPMLNFLTQGYKVICVENFEKVFPALPKNFYNFSGSAFLLLQKVLNSKDGSDLKLPSVENEAKFVEALKAIIKKSSADNIYIFSEGMYSNALLKNFDTNFAEDVRGAFFVYDKNTLSEIEETAWAFSTSYNKQIIFDEKLKNAKFFFYAVPENFFCRFSEIRGDDLLMANLLGAELDTGRKTRLEIANIFEKWIYVKE